MVKHECPTCNRGFQRKGNLDDHLNKKNRCKPEIIIPQNPAQISQNPAQIGQIPAQIDHKELNAPIATKNDLDCNYCNKSFARKDILRRHIKNYCCVVKQHNKEKQEIFDRLILEDTKKQEIIDKLKEDKEKQEILIDKLKSENELLGKIKQLEDGKKQLEDGTKNLENEIKTLKKAMKKTQPITNNTLNNNNNINIGNTTNIIMVSYGHEDLSKITTKMLSAACKKGYNSIVHLVETVHFNPDFPENHNVYIPSVKDKHAMIFYDDMWNLKNKDDVVNDMYDSNRDFIMDNIEGISNSLNDGEKRALNRWLDSEKNKDKSDKDKKAIEITHENLKLLLHNKRHIPIGTRKQKTTIAN